MRKILTILILCLLVITNAHFLSADSDTHKKKDDSIASTQLQLFQLSVVLEQLNLQMGPTFQLPRFDLLETNKLKLFRPRPPVLKWQTKRRLGRAVLEGVAHFIYATSSYWIRQDVMKEDWEYQLNWKDQTRRFLFKDGVRFDSNTFQFNWTHSLAGAIYYNYARSNHLNPMASFAYTLSASYLWEFVVEFKEVISFNDMIATPIGGISIGESMFQLGRFFRSQRPTFINKIARFISNPVMAISDFLDRKKPGKQYAFRDRYWNDNRLTAGGRFDTLIDGVTKSFMNLGFESQLILIPEYGSPSTISKGISSTLFTQFDLGGTIGSEGMYQFNIFAKSTFFGHFWQDIRSEGDTEYGEEQLTGYSLFLGASSAFDMMKQDPTAIPTSDSGPDTDQFEYVTDKYTVINLLGPTLDLTLYKKDFRLRLTTDAYADFALIHSHAYKRYSELHTFGQTKSTLENHGYYYAFGITLSSMLQLNYANLELKGKFKYHYFDSVEGLDRFQDDIADEDDFDLKDHRFNFDISLGYRIPSTDIQLALGVQQFERKGIIEDFSQKHTESRTYFQIRYLF